MRKPLAVLAVVLLCLPAFLLASQEPLRVFVSVAPELALVEGVAGDRVEVEALIRPGLNPHAFEPTPAQIARLSGAALYFGVGLPFEHAWMRRVQAASPSLRFVDLSQGLQLRQIEDHAHAEESHAHRGAHAEADTDPHVWTSPLAAIQMAGVIAAKLREIDPSHAALYDSRLADLTSELKRLDSDIRATLSGLERRRFMVYHPAWGYFADTYDLEQIPIEAEGKEPGPSSLAALIDQARQEDVRVIFVQPQFSTKAARQVAREIGGRVEVVDNLAPDYVANLRRVAKLIAESQD